ncbi:SDR family oxidoreductase [Micromonospora sp. PLK6-60]|uniref:SDR family oxidoreductase n=1 Tax=Micromonospora sp. PLK6-60 TaxID=2873383 RepID=UPI001CA6D1D1|nr:SDR family NAD(P)-dependent oxidoreductase [Micromonospora sp. PLK6-60]MBY8870773.1 SDR family oxidoreductase [Micromonospora sp. PLK6-60]
MTHVNGSGPVALVTGGARGIGRAMCERLARDGFRVVVNYRSDATAARSLVERLRSAGAQAVEIQADVCDSEQAAHLIDAAAQHFGTGVSVLVNNVGEFSLSPVSATSAQRWDEVITSNLSSAFYTTRAALPAMREQRYGRVVTLGLSASLVVRGAPNIAAYSVAKTGIAVLTRSLAVEEAPHGITVNCVAPGLIDNGHLHPAQREWMAKRVPAGRLGTGEEIAEAVAFLVSDRAAYISGATLAVAGAWDWEDRPTDHDEGVFEVYEEQTADV